jgi:hypothetical protein
MTAHSKIGASSMYRWSQCPGSVKLSEGVPNVSSAYAQGGTDAHELAATCLQDGVLTSGDEAVDVYLEAVHEENTEGTTLHVETSFDLSAIHPGCFGTADAVVWNPLSRLLTVMDYKHGAGIPVSVWGNPQLRYYGLGALLSLGYPADKVKLVIVQPRCDHADGPVRSETIDAMDLLDFAADLKRFAVATEAENAPLKAGEHCRFCPAGKALKCPEVKNKAQAIAKTVFQPSVSYDPAELARCLDARETVKAWLKNLDEFAYAEAEAGRCPPGYKLVDKQGRRKWKADLSPPHPVTAPDWYEPAELKSPAQLEKLKDPAAKKFAAANTIKESSGHVLVPEDGKRPAVTRATAQDVFLPAPSPGETAWP